MPCTPLQGNSDGALDITSPMKPRGFPSWTDTATLSQQYAQAILVHFRTKISEDLFVIPNLNSTLRTYNDAHQNRLAGSIHAYSFRWPSAHSHGSRLFSLCWAAKNRFRIICTALQGPAPLEKVLSSPLLRLHIYLSELLTSYQKNAARSNRLT